MCNKNIDFLLKCLTIQQLHLQSDNFLSQKAKNLYFHFQRPERFANKQQDPYSRTQKTTKQPDQQPS